jgi:hypothetical protein
MSILPRSGPKRARCLSEVAADHYLEPRLMTDQRPLISPEFDARQSQRRALVALAVLLGFYLWATWGYVGSFYGEASAWLHEVDRYAAGETPYRDFTWQFPPLSMWVVGGIARVLGTSLLSLNLITSCILVLLYLAFHRLVAKVAPGVGASALVTAFVFASAYAARFSPPLSVGGAAPAGPLGMLFLLVAVGLVVRLGDRPQGATAAGVGLSLGLAALSRHDYWLPGLFLLAWGIAAVRHDPARGRLRAVLGTAFGGTLAAGAVIALATAGPAALSGLLPHGVREAFLQGLPSGERLTMEIAAASALGIAGVVALWLCFALEDARALRMTAVLLLVFLSACATHLGMSVAAARDIAEHGLSANPTAIEEALARLAPVQHPLRTAVYLLDQRFQTHLFPALLPPILLAVLVLRWRRWGLRRDRDLALLMLGLAIALRARRGFSGTDWQNVLVEIPAYALFLHLVAAAVGRSAQRAVSMALAILFVVGLYTYYNLGVGPLTQRRYPPTATARGTVHWEPASSADYRAWAAVLDSLDPDHRRPLLAFGPSGAWNYFLARPNPTRFTRGFTADADAETVHAALRAASPRPLILDTRRVVRITPPLRPGPFAWEIRPARTPVTLLELPALAGLLAGCRVREGIPSEPGIPLYDCVEPPATPPDSSR